uniref:protein kinase domain-containing protein n=1 Tax=Nevskia soli TaxID=418856 RepID=UPI0015D7478E
MPISIGSRIGPYEITGLIGSGGMGTVFRARDTRLNRDVAIKLLLPALAADDELLRRFHVESQSASALNHPNILTVYDVGADGHEPYLVTELLEGESL